MEESASTVGPADAHKRITKSSNLQRISCGLIASLLIVIVYLSLVTFKYCQLPSTLEKLLLSWASRPHVVHVEPTSCPKCAECPKCTKCAECPTCPLCEECKPCISEVQTLTVLTEPDPSLCPKGLKHCSVCYDGECLACAPGYSLPALGCFIECHEKCKVCDAYDPTYCIECLDSANSEPPECIDLTVCLPSMPNCAGCQGNEVCITCRPGYSGPETGCTTQCDSRCAECSPDNFRHCTVCANATASDPPHCYPEGVCDPGIEDLTNCMECSRSQCLRCKAGYAMPSSQCKVRCSNNCLTCDQTEPSICTECANASAQLPECLPYGECSVTNPAVSNCATCNGSTCLTCVTGWSGSAFNCAKRCAASCAACSDMDAASCTVCKDETRHPPLCLPLGECDQNNTELQYCSRCDGNVCITCRPGFSRPEQKCLTKCLSLCTDCSPQDPTLCLTCADSSRHLPRCLPFGDCDQFDASLQFCKTCDGATCLSCKDGFTNLSDGCVDRCSELCATCHLSDASMCITCVSGNATPPLCLPPGQCLDTDTYKTCKSCIDERCTECKDGYTGDHCREVCHTYCKTCMINDATYCGACSIEGTEPPYCYPPGECNPELASFCSTCTGNRCTSCKEGMTDVSHNCNDVCSDWCRSCSDTNPEECIVCRYRGMQLPYCMPPSSRLILMNTLRDIYNSNTDMALIYGLALFTVPIFTSYLAIYLLIRRGGVLDDKESQ
ncbi:Hypothetical protein GSB_150417 [Giardia duodenalis]|uniref:EGF-like domain-containing protein n=1 Tax=Giardia intestinalis TaxID=5741 RepID=V6TXM9_GIAIN|nr:Hypothetical protein GSB_150417 [Giardia intestinalis]